MTYAACGALIWLVALASWAITFTFIKSQLGQLGDDLILVDIKGRP
jgi:hypothetical protein